MHGWSASRRIAIPRLSWRFSRKMGDGEPKRPLPSRMRCWRLITKKRPGSSKTRTQQLLRNSISLWERPRREARARQGEASIEARVRVRVSADLEILATLFQRGELVRLR